MTVPRSGWREPMVWLVVLLPASVVVAGFATLAIAIGSGGNDAVPDAVHRTAQVQTAELGPDDEARRLDLTAVLQVDTDSVQVLPVRGSFDRHSPLRLTLSHPVHADADISVELRPDTTGWMTELTVDGTHDWQVQLSSEGAGWRVQGRLPAGQQATHLTSSLHDAKVR